MKKRELKRKMISILLWNTIGVMSHCMMQLNEVLRLDISPVHSDHPLKGCFSEKEWRALRQRCEKQADLLEDFRKIAKHLGK